MVKRSEMEKDYRLLKREEKDRIMSKKNIDKEIEDFEQKLIEELNQKFWFNFWDQFWKYFFFVSVVLFVFWLITLL